MFPTPAWAARGDGQSCASFQSVERNGTGANILGYRVWGGFDGRNFEYVVNANSAGTPSLMLCADRNVIWTFADDYISNPAATAVPTVPAGTSTPTAVPWQGQGYRYVRWGAVSRDGAPFSLVDAWVNTGTTQAGGTLGQCPVSGSFLVNSTNTCGVVTINRFAINDQPTGVYAIWGGIVCGNSNDPGANGCSITASEGEGVSLFRGTATPLPAPLNATVQAGVATQVAANVGPILTAVKGVSADCVGCTVSAMPGAVQTAIIGDATRAARTGGLPTATILGGVAAASNSVNCSTNMNLGWSGDVYYNYNDAACLALNQSNQYLLTMAGNSENELVPIRYQATAIKNMWVELASYGQQQVAVQSTIAGDIGGQVVPKLTTANSYLSTIDGWLGYIYVMETNNNNQLKAALTPQSDVAAKLGTVVVQDRAAATAMGGLASSLNANNSAVQTAISNVINTNTGLLSGIAGNQVTLNNISYGINEGQATAAAGAELSALSLQQAVDHLGNIAVFGSGQATVSARATVPGWQSDAGVVNAVATLTGKYVAPVAQYTQVAGWQSDAGVVNAVATLTGKYVAPVAQYTQVAVDAGVVNAVSTLTGKYQAPVAQFTQVAVDTGVVNAVSTLTGKYVAPAVQYTQVAGWQSDAGVVNAVATLTGKYVAPVAQYTQVGGWQSDTAVVEAVATSGARAYPTADGAVSAALVGIRAVSEASGTSVAGVADAIRSLGTPVSPSALWAPLTDQVRVRPTFAAEARGTVVAVVAERIAPVNAWGTLATSLVDGLTDDCAAIPTITLPAIAGGATVGMVPSWFSDVWCQFRTLTGYVVIVLSVFTAVPAFVRLFGSGGVR